MARMEVPAKNGSGWRRLRRYFACGYFQWRMMLLSHAYGLMTRDESWGLLLLMLMLLIVIGNDAAVEKEPREFQWIHCAVPPDQEKCPSCRCRCQAIQDLTRLIFPVP